MFRFVAVWCCGLVQFDEFWQWCCVEMCCFFVVQIDEILGVVVWCGAVTGQWVLCGVGVALVFPFVAV